MTQAMPVTRLELDRVKNKLPFGQLVADTVDEMIRDGDFVIVEGDLR
jgi:hypothetical protein